MAPGLAPASRRPDPRSQLGNRAGLRSRWPPRREPGGLRPGAAGE